MRRYIDAEKLEKDGWSASRTYQQDAHTTVYETKKMTDFPTTDVRENVHAHWITHEYKVNGYDHAYCECSACNVSRPITLFQLNFCPNCGAVMDERREDD